MLRNWWSMASVGVPTPHVFWHHFRLSSARQVWLYMFESCRFFGRWAPHTLCYVHDLCRTNKDWRKVDLTGEGWLDLQMEDQTLRPRLRKDMWPLCSIKTPVSVSRRAIFAAIFPIRGPVSCSWERTILFICREAETLCMWPDVNID